MSGSNEIRIVLLGKTGSGKSSLGNTVLEDSLFKAKCSAVSVTSECQVESKNVKGIKTTVVDTPGFFDTNMPEKNAKSEIVKCITECTPGPHVFLIVLKVERYTNQEQDIIYKILQTFSDKALKHAIVVFTHGDQLDEGQKIEDFVRTNEALTELVKKCGDRCYVVDNKYWNNNDDDDEYRNNKFQVTQLLNTIEKMKQSGGCYTNEMFQKVEEIKKTSKDKADLIKKLVNIFAGVSVGALLGGLLGVGLTPDHPVLAALTGALVGGGIGYGAGEQASSAGEAALKTVQSVGQVGQALTQAKHASQGGDSQTKASQCGDSTKFCTVL